MDPFQNVCSDDIQFNFYNPDEHSNDLDPLLPWDIYSFNEWEKEESWRQSILENGSEESPKSLGDLPAHHTHSDIQSLSQTSDDSLHGDSNSLENVSVEIRKEKKRKRRMEKGPMFVFCTRSPTDKLDDGYKWRKYGKKTIKSSPHQRSYYMCSDSNCMVKKRVERDARDREVVITSYEGKHNHESPSPIPIYSIHSPFLPSTLHLLLLNPSFSSHSS